MRVCNEKMKIGLLSFAVQGALAAMLVVPGMVSAADPTEAEIAVIRRPTNFVEIGAENVVRSSAKFGEYNGLNKSGGVAIGNFSVRGGDAYQGGDGTMRWGFTGSDLGTTSREFGANVGSQGKWSFGFGYDELRHNITNSYQTPYQGAMGGNNFTLPATYVINNTTTNDTRNLTALQQSLFNTVEIGSNRKNASLNAGFNIDKQWDIKFDFNNLKQTGAKLMGFGQYGGITGATGQAVAILPNPTNYTTNTYNLALNWVGDKGHATASYFGSFFRNEYDRVTFQAFQGANTPIYQTMSTMPGNQLHQLNLTGGYNLTAKTKIAGGVSYSRNTQNESFAYDALQMQTAAPKSSLDGLVVTTHADLKLTDRTIKDLTLAAGFKYDRRNNRTQSNIYDFLAINGGDRTNYPNTPLSIQKVQYELAGDYRLDKTQNVRFAYDRENTHRWCNNYAVGGNIVGGVPLYSAGTNCVVATGSKEDKLSVAYKLKASDDLNLNAGYSIASRRTDADVLARVAMVSRSGNLTSGAGTTADPGLNGGDYRGFVPYFDEDRLQKVLKAGVNWQADEKFSLGANGRYTQDTYSEMFGWKKGKQWSLNLDAAYNYTENGSVSAYLTQQQRKRDREDKRNGNSPTAATATVLGIPSNSTDSGTLTDNDTTIGLGFKQAGLMGNKLELAGDLTYSLGKTVYGTTLNWNAVNTLGTLNCSSPQFLICGDLPAIKNDMIQLKLTGTYKVDKSSSIAMGFLHRRLNSTDYYYNGLAVGNNATTMLPTGQQAPSYSVNVVSATYSYSFK